MMSKNSFLINMKENIKRRNWVAACSFLSLFFYFPICLAVMLQNTTRQIAEYGPVVSLEEVSERMLSMGDGSPLAIAFLIAIFSSIQGFSYLYQTKKVDFYHSVPVSKKKRFLTIYINGILLYVIPYLVNLLLGILVAIIYNSFNVKILSMIFTGFIGNLLFYLCIYHIGILAVMLTGNLVITGFAVIVFLFYEILVKYLLSGFTSIFFENSYVFRTDLFKEKALFSPLTVVAKYFSEASYRWQGMGSLLLGLLWVAFIWGIAAYIAYYFRPAEACKKAMAFEKSKAIIKIALMIPISLYAGTFFSEFSKGNEAFAVFGFFAALILSHAVIESIYEFDIKASFSKKRQIIYGGVLAGALFAVFFFDIFGYDNYVPKKEKLENVGIYLNDCIEDIRDENGNYQSPALYQLEHVAIENAELILLLAEKGKELTGQQDEYNRIKVCYNLKNGKKVFRQIPVDMENTETVEILNTLYTDGEYKKQAYQFYSESKLNNVKEIKLFVGNGISALPVEEHKIQEFLEIYKEEFLALDYITRYQELPSAEFSIVYVMERGEKDSPDYYEMTFSSGYPIYDTFQETMRFLKTEGLYQEPKPSADKITGITVDLEKIETSNYGIRTGEMASLVESIFIEGKDEIEQIVPSLYSGELASYRIQRNTFYASASVRFAESVNDIRYNDYEEGGRVGYFIFENGEIPDFLKEKMK